MVWVYEDLAKRLPNCHGYVWFPGWRGVREAVLLDRLW
jgi:hypothetical protein